MGGKETGTTNLYFQILTKILTGDSGPLLDSFHYHSASVGIRAINWIQG